MSNYLMIVERKEYRQLAEPATYPSGQTVVQEIVTEHPIVVTADFTSEAILKGEKILVFLSCYREKVIWNLVKNVEGRTFCVEVV